MHNVYNLTAYLPSVYNVWSMHFGLTHIRGNYFKEKGISQIYFSIIYAVVSKYPLYYCGHDSEALLYFFSLISWLYN